MADLPKNKTVIIIGGPTGVGKTSYAIRLARQYQAEIISCDSRQCYRELNIGVARPSPQELALVPHHFIASHSVTENLNAADFASYALEKCDHLFTHHDYVVMVGGTGLYIQAFCEGLDELPPVPTDIRDMVRSGYKEKGMEWLQEEIKKLDPVFYQEGEIQNPARMMRALEVVMATGNSILTYRTRTKKERPFNIVRKTLELPRVELYHRIDKRVDEMIAAGLVKEVGELLPYRHLKALNTVGYKELFRHLDGELSLEEAISLIKQNTRNYAKRQVTWFKKYHS